MVTKILDRIFGYTPSDTTAPPPTQWIAPAPLPVQDRVVINGTPYVLPQDWQQQRAAREKRTRPRI